MDIVTSIGAAFIDDAGRPLQNIRIRHTHILEDPFPDPPGLDPHIPEASPEPEFEQVGALPCLKHLDCRAGVHQPWTTSMLGASSASLHSSWAALQSFLKAQQHGTHGRLTEVVSCLCMVWAEAACLTSRDAEARASCHRAPCECIECMQSLAFFRMQAGTRLAREMISGPENLFWAEASACTAL